MASISFNDPTRSAPTSSVPPLSLGGGAGMRVGPPESGPVMIHPIGGGVSGAPPMYGPVPIIPGLHNPFIADLWARLQQGALRAKGELGYGHFDPNRPGGQPGLPVANPPVEGPVHPLPPQHTMPPFRELQARAAAAALGIA